MSKTKTIIFFIVGLILLDSGVASAEKVCARVRRGKLEKQSVVSGNCPRGFLLLVDTATMGGAAGATGPAGAAGADGAIRVFGDGSDGPITFSSSGTFPENRQYTDIVINSGVTMTVQADTIIRCTGTITINGRLFASGAAGNLGLIGTWPSSSTYLAAYFTVPERNISGSSALSGAVATVGAAASGGSGGFAPSNSARIRAALFANPLRGGGHGAGAIGTFGGAGGGPIVVLCRQGISIPAGGQIDSWGSDGGAGAGGGAGGTVLLASRGEISGAGTIDVHAGNGGNASTTSGPGGGGGGGLIHMFAPVVSFAGTTVVTPGTGQAGAAPGAVNSGVRSGGAGGGAAGGNGGSGGSLNNDDSSSASSNGDPGVFYTATLDPTALLLMQ